MVSFLFVLFSQNYTQKKNLEKNLKLTKEAKLKVIAFFTNSFICVSSIHSTPEI
jgi:hypothetical protein